MDPLPTPSNDSGPSASVAIPRARPWASPLRILLVVLLLGASMSALRRNNTAGVDYIQFWHIGRTVVHGRGADPYSESGGREVARELAVLARHGRDSHLREAASRRGTLVPTSTPLLYSMFGVFSSASYSESLEVYRVVQLVCFVVAVLGFGALTGLSLDLSLVALILLLTESQALASELRVGNVNALQLLGLWLYVWLRLRAPVRQRELLSAMWFGVLIAFKPNLLLVGCVLLLHPFFSKKWARGVRHALSMATGVLLAVLLAGAIWGDVGAWLHWLQAGRRILSGVATVKQGNFASVALFPDQSPTFVSSLLILVVAVLAFCGMYLRSKATEPLARPLDSQVLWYLSVGCLVSLLLTHLAWVHYYLLVVPALLFLTSRWRCSPNAQLSLVRTVIVLVAWLLFAMGPLRPLNMSTMTEGKCMLLGILLLLGGLWAEPEAPRIRPEMRRIRGGA